MAIAAGAFAASDLLNDFRIVNGGAQPVGSTIGRVRMDITFTTAGASPGSTTGLIGGLIIGTSSLVDVPDPGTADERYADWMWWRFLSIHRNSSLVNATGVSVATFEVDVKSMRRMEELQETLWLVFDNPSPATINVSVTASVLLMLP